ncbi:hypothetical protein L3Q82_002121 [Scortum barcoo]|uniref:Uncharacterized protein n=1 Tax=Scortum barcoo TaxID=214431 RepID=A0ACB8W224_9TELE|nr:hypothetical protein L3Q82_002121 [Scortum barcoo]
MSDLPSERITPARPFEYTTVDLFGPYEVKDEVRKKVRLKVWGIVFCCMASRALHTDIVSDQSSEGFLLAYKRFTALRGHPKKLWSDPGKNFVGARPALRDLYIFLDQLEKSEIENEASKHGTEWNWKFHPADSPHRNGAAEAAVHTVKRALHNLGGDGCFTWGEFQTFLYMAANLANERPIDARTQSREDCVDYISPNSLLLGRSGPRGDLGSFEFEGYAYKRLRAIQTEVDRFWRSTGKGLGKKERAKQANNPCALGGLIALLLLILLFTLVLYTRHRWCKRRRIPQKSASTEATHEIHYIPSVLLGPQGRDSYRGSRGTHQHGSSVIGMPIRETPILDDYDCDEEDQGGHSLNSTPSQLHTKLNDGKVQEDYGVNIGIGGHTDMMCKDNEIKHNFEKRAIDPNTESVEDLMQRFQDSFRVPNTPTDMSHYQHVIHSSSTGRRRVPSHTRGAERWSFMGKVLPDRSTAHIQERCGYQWSSLEFSINVLAQLMEKCKYAKACERTGFNAGHSPLNKVTLTLITISTCVVAIVYATQDSCPLTVKVTLHVPEHFVADGSSFVVSMGSFLDVSNWLNPAKLTLYYQTNSSTQWVRDYCGQRATEPCEQICDQDTVTTSPGPPTLHITGQESTAARLYFLRKLKRASAPPPIMTTFYRGTIESILTSCITVWGGSYTVHNRKALQRIVRTAERIIGVPLPSLQDLYTTRLTQKAITIVNDASHPAHSLFSLLPSGKRRMQLS